MNRKAQYQSHISGLKGIACLMIVETHYLGVLQFDRPLPPSYWLYLFFVVSGYVLGLGQIRNAYQVLKKSILRFVRLAVPVFFSYCVIFLLYKTVGFHNASASAETTDWFRSFYQTAYSVRDVLLGPVRVLCFGDASLNSPYWVLREMLIASVVIYMLRYFREWIPVWGSFVLTLGVMAVSYGLHRTILVSCLMGYFAAVCLPEPGKLPWKGDWSLFLLAAVVMINLLPKLWFALPVYGAVLYLLPVSPWLSRLLSSKTTLFLGSVSWGVFSFHWPLMCSVGAWMLCTWGSSAAVWLIACAVCAAATILLSWLYERCFGKPSRWIQEAASASLDRLYLWLGGRP